MDGHSFACLSVKGINDSIKICISIEIMRAPTNAEIMRWRSPVVDWSYFKPHTLIGDEREFLHDKSNIGSMFEALPIFVVHITNERQRKCHKRNDRSERTNSFPIKIRTAQKSCDNRACKKQGKECRRERKQFLALR